jgi:hypothetical protein
MTNDDLKQVAIDYLGQAFKAEIVPPPHMMQAAVSLVLTPRPKETPSEQMPDLMPITRGRS